MELTIAKKQTKKENYAPKYALFWGYTFQIILNKLLTIQNNITALGNFPPPPNLRGQQFFNKKNWF